VDPAVVELLEVLAHVVETETPSPAAEAADVVPGVGGRIQPQGHGVEAAAADASPEAHGLSLPRRETPRSISGR